MLSKVLATLTCLISAPLFGQTFNTLHNFTDQSMTDPDEPNSTPVEVSPGVFYGTTQVGGANEVGTLFSITSRVLPEYPVRSDLAGNVTTVVHAHAERRSNTGAYRGP